MGIGFMKGNRVPRVTINVSAETGGVAFGGGKYTRGRQVKLGVTVAPLYGFTGWYDGNVLLSESKDFEFVARRSMDIVAKIKRVVHNTGFSRYTSHCNDVWDIVSPALYRIDYVNGVRPKSVQFYYRVNSIGGDHGYLWTTSTFSGSVDQNFSQTVASSTGQGGTKILTAALKFYDTYFTLQGNMSFSCREDFVGTMIYD